MSNDKITLDQLRLHNFATFTFLSVNFNPRFNCITGETGSGKSLILDALNILFGNRADKKFIRKSCDHFVLEGIFKINGSTLRSYLEDLGLPVTKSCQEIIIKRIISRSGTSKCYLNDMSCSLGSLKKFVQKFVDLVGQFENQKLLEENYQLALLDKFGSKDDLLKDYRKEFERLNTIKAKLSELEEQDKELDLKIDYLDFQLSEIEDLSPSLEDEITLIDSKKELQGKLEKGNLFKGLLALVSNGENKEDILSSLARCISLTETEDGFFPENQVQNLKKAHAHVEEFSFFLSKLNSSAETESELNKIIDRLDRYQKLKRKFGGTTELLLEKYLSFKEERQALLNLDQEITRLNQQIMEQKALCQSIASDLHSSRLESANILSTQLTTSIHSLNMTGATFQIDVKKKTALDKNGLTKISFLSETNEGEGFYNISDIASGGELSRILLAIRSIISANDNISVYLFDEIESGIGGETALSIGKALKKVSENSQVITITHLPQIASQSDLLINVFKKTVLENEMPRTTSEVSLIKNKKDLKAFTKSMVPLS